MKITTIVLFFLLFNTSVFCQNIPNSYVNVGISLGQSSGGLGLKTVIGYRNSGLLFGIGSWGAGITGYKIGGQISIHHFYAEIGYGVVSITQENNYAIYPISAGSMLIGGMFGLGKTKHVFIDIGVGYSFGAKIQTMFGEIKAEVLCYNIGIGYRIGNKKNKIN